jgi:hypothetical protein
MRGIFKELRFLKRRNNFFSPTGEALVRGIFKELRFLKRRNKI